MRREKIIDSMFFFELFDNDDLISAWAFNYIVFNKCYQDDTLISLVINYSLLGEARLESIEKFCGNK